MSEPTNAEVIRRLGELKTLQEEMRKELRDERNMIDKVYVRKDLWAEAHSALIFRVSELERSEESREKTAADTRRQVMLLLLGLAIPAIGGLILSVNTYLASGGH